MPAALMQPLTAPPSSIHPSSVSSARNFHVFLNNSKIFSSQIQHIHPSNRMRIAPVNPALISSARSRDPRIRIRQSEPAPSLLHHPHPVSLSSVAKSLPRIPKLSQSNNNHKSSLRNSERDRDPRSRRNKEKDSLKPSKTSPASKDKLKSLSLKLKSGSSDDSSPRKKSEEEKKSSKNSSSSHRSHSRHHSSKIAEPQDVDLRVPMEITMKPDSTTSNNKDKLLTDLLNGENMKSSHEMITSDENGKENQPILVVTINSRQFIVTTM